MNKLPGDFLNAVLTDEDVADLRNNVLDRALETARARRRQRRLLQYVCFPAIAVACAVAIAIISTERAGPMASSEAANQASHTAPKTYAPIDRIGDSELLALFPEGTLALIGPPDNQRLLVFRRE